MRRWSAARRTPGDSRLPGGPTRPRERGASRPEVPTACSSLGSCVPCFSVRSGAALCKFTCAGRGGFPGAHLKSKFRTPFPLPQLEDCTFSKAFSDYVTSPSVAASAWWDSWRLLGFALESATIQWGRFHSLHRRLIFGLGFCKGINPNYLWLEPGHVKMKHLFSFIWSV